MDVTFGSAALAALCNSEERLGQRWGPDIGRTVGRRLFDIAGTSAATLDRLPEAKVTVSGAGETTITFADRIVVRGVISPSKDGTAAARTDTDRIVITSLDVHESERR